jgi:urea transport system permease protein
LIDPLTLKDAGSAPASSLSQIGTNNALRRVLRMTLARFSLSSPDAAVRSEAAREMSKSLDDQTAALLRERLRVETNSGVRKEISTALALAALDGPDTGARLAGGRHASRECEPGRPEQAGAVARQIPRRRLREKDEKVRQAAASAVATIDRWRTFYSAIQTLFFGLSLGSVLVLIAIGLAITFGVMGVINMAHGELMMLGAYTTYVVQTAMPGHIGISILVAIPAAFIVSGLMGVVLERTIIRFLYGRPLETLLATFGVSLILQQTVRSIFTALNRSVVTPDWMSGSLRLNDALSITYNRLYIVIFTLIVFAAIQLVLKRTRLGLDIRAVSQNRSHGEGDGYPDRVGRCDDVRARDRVSPGVAGVALSQLTNVGPDLGQSYIIDSFMVVVFGGVGNLWGSLIGGMSMGVVNSCLNRGPGRCWLRFSSSSR